MRLPTPGDLLAGKYRVDSVLGEGGFGVVMRGVTVSTGRPVAVKVLKTRDDHSAVTRAQRFLREMRAIAQLQSPHTLTLYDFGRTEHGALFMVCEYVEGEDLLDLLARRGTLSEPEVVWLLWQVLQSLSEAHGAGILHRDIKPANIRVFEYESDPLSVKVLDFGLAISLDPGEARLTGTGKVIGTPRYMSPEQLRALDLTPATDLFSLAVVAVEMLLGREATATRARGSALRISKDAPVSPKLRDLLHRMLAPLPEDRPQRAEDVLAELRLMREAGSQKVRAQPRAAPPPPSTASSEQATGRSRSNLAIAAAAVLIISAVFVLGLLMSQHDEPTVVVHSTRSEVPFVAAKPAPDASDDSAATVDAAPEPATTCGASGIKPGATAHRLGEAIWWNVHVPERYDGESRLPMIVLLADQLNARPGFLAETGLIEVAEREGYAVAAPVLRDASLVSDWESIIRSEYLAEVVDELEDLLCIDPGKIFLYAEGQGAMKVRHIACDSWVAAVVTHHDRPKRPYCTRHVPYLHFAPKDSVYIPLEGSRGCMKLAPPNREIAKHDEDWRRQNRCNEQRASRTLAEGVECYEYRGCASPTLSCRTSGGFGWPNSSIKWLHDGLCSSEPDPEPFPAAELAIDFFGSVQSRTPPRSAGCGEPAPDPGLTQLTALKTLSEYTTDVYVPRHYDAQVPHPVLILAHRDGQTGADMLDVTRFAELADREGVVIVLPTDSSVASWREPSSVDVVQSAVELVERSLCVDSTRVYVVGHGSGGFASRDLACEPWVTAVAMNSWREESLALPCGDPSPSIHLSPLDSKRMLIDGGTDCLVVGHPLSLEHHDAMWAAGSGCSEERTSKKRYRDGVCLEYRHCDADFVACHLDGGFGWPGSSARPPDLSGLCNDPRSDFPAEEVIWEFFASVPPLPERR